MLGCWLYCLLLCVADVLLVYGRLFCLGGGLYSVGFCLVSRFAVVCCFDLLMPIFGCGF